MIVARRRLLALAGAPLLAPLPAVGRVPLAATPIARLDLPWWRDRHQAKLSEKANNQLVWLGDSITQAFEHAGQTPRDDYAAVWNRYYAPRRALNLGFSGDTTANALWRVENGELEGLSPRLLILLIGANNLGKVRWSAPDTVAGIAAILDAVHSRLPATRVLLLGVLPRAGDAWVIDTQRQTNAALAGRSWQSVEFKDPSPLFQRDGAIDDDLYADPGQSPPRLALHPTAEGMARIAAFIEPSVAAVLGSLSAG